MVIYSRKVSMSSSKCKKHNYLREFLRCMDFITNQATVLMIDIEMPCMNGLSFLKMFSAKLPIISTSTKKEFSSQAMQLGCVEYL